MLPICQSLYSFRSLLILSHRDLLLPSSLVIIHILSSHSFAHSHNCCRGKYQNIDIANSPSGQQLGSLQFFLNKLTIVTQCSPRSEPTGAVVDDLQRNIPSQLKSQHCVFLSFHQPVIGVRIYFSSACRPTVYRSNPSQWLSYRICTTQVLPGSRLRAIGN